MTDEDLMRRCLELGGEALAVGDAPVGSLIVKRGEIIAEGIEAVKSKKDPTAHSEIEAIRAACEKLHTLNLNDCDLYTNVEPCVMCAFAIRQTGIQRIVFGISNNEVGGANSKFAVLSDTGFPAKFAPPEICGGVLLEECEALRQRFEKVKKSEMKTNAN